MRGQAGHLASDVRFGMTGGLCRVRHVLMALSFALLFTAWAGAPAQANSRYAAIVIDAATGEVFHESRADRELYPASLTKIMTLYMTFKAIDEGKLTLNQKIPISKHAAGQAPSKLGLPAGSSIRVEDAIYALVTKSANDIASALGEAVGGTEWEFAQMATAQARKLGMRNTTFRNAHGLPNDGQISTARDMATLAQAMMRDFPQHYHYFETRRWSYRGQTYRTHNRLMETYPGMDGLKTGYIRASGFNLVASAVRGNLRLIAVVFGGTTSARRNARVAELLDEAFDSTRGEYMIAHGQSIVLPFDPPLPPRHPGAMGSVMVAETAGEQLIESAARVVSEVVAAANPIPPALADVPVPATPPAAIESGHADLSLVALSDETALAQGGIGGDIPVADWGIQVGAFTDSISGDRALSIAQSLLPDLLGPTEHQLTEVYTRHGRLFRARLIGLNQDSAALACTRLTEAGNDCLTIAPENAF